jgi:hypothetical protein
MLLVSVSITLIGQKKPTDLIDLKNIDIDYMESLLFDKFLTEFKKNKELEGNFIKDSIIIKQAMEYQLSYLEENKILDHDNKKYFRGVFLEGPKDRLLYFMGKNNVEKSKGKVGEDYSYGFYRCYEVLSHIKIGFGIRDTVKRQYYVFDSVHYKKCGGYNFIPVKEKKDDGREYYYKEGKSYRCKTYDDDYVFDDMLTYEYIVNILYERFMDSPFHNYAITSGYENNGKCYWKFKFKYNDYKNKSIEFWSGSIFQSGYY